MIIQTKNTCTLDMNNNKFKSFDFISLYYQRN